MTARPSMTCSTLSISSTAKASAGLRGEWWGMPKQIKRNTWQIAGSMLTPTFLNYLLRKTIDNLTSWSTSWSEEWLQQTDACAFGMEMMNSMDWDWGQDGNGWWYKVLRRNRILQTSCQQLSLLGQGSAAELMKLEKWTIVNVLLFRTFPFLVSPPNQPQTESPWSVAGAVSETLETQLMTKPVESGAISRYHLKSIQWTFSSTASSYLVRNRRDQ